MHTANNTDGRRHAQKQTFALTSQLLPRFHQRGITETKFLDAIKLDLGVESRSEIDEVGYVRLAARLQTAKRHQHMFESLCREIERNKATGE